MTEDGRIHGKVVATLDKRELYLNVGSADGVDPGMRFAILTPHGVELTDPDTNEVLGTVDVPKTVVKVVRVEGPHLSVARTFRTIRGRAALGSATALASLMGTPDRVETLKTDSDSSVFSDVSNDDMRVRRGDPAVSTSGDEYDDE